MDARFDQPGGPVTVRREAGDTFLIIKDGRESVPVVVVPLADGSFQVPGAGRGFAARDGSLVWVHWKGRTWRLEVDHGQRHARGSGGDDLSSPMPGQVQKLLTGVGEVVEAQQPLLVIEAMKMQIEIKAPHAGTVTAILAGEGDKVDAGAPLVELQEAAE